MSGTICRDYKVFLPTTFRSDAWTYTGTRLAATQLWARALAFLGCLGLLITKKAALGCSKGFSHGERETSFLIKLRGILL